MTTGTADDTDTRRNSAQRLPEFPGENFLAHQGSQWLESAEAIMAAAQLISVAKGFPPQSTACIVDVDLDDLPALPAYLPASASTTSVALACGDAKRS